MAKHKKLNLSTISLILVLVVICCAALMYALSDSQVLEKLKAPTETELAQQPDSSSQSIAYNPDSADESNILPFDGKLNVYVIDIGQGDSILAISPDGKTMLVDTGERSEYPQLKKFLASLDIQRIDVFIATHPHSDHIGGAANLLSDFEIGKMYLPKFAHTSKTFENMLLAIKQNKVDASYLKGQKGKKLEWSDDISLSVLAPLEDEYKEINDYSIVLKLEFGKTSILLTGDSEAVSEKQMLKVFTKQELSADLLKLGHHGSSSSSTKKFLDAVSPKIAIASAGQDNKYKHPSKEVVDRLREMNIELFTTAQNGTVQIVLDGKEASVFSQR